MSYFIVFLSYSVILYWDKVAFSSEEIYLKNHDLLLDQESLEPLLSKENEDNKKENEISHSNGINDEKLIPSLLYKRNKGK